VRFETHTLARWVPRAVATAALLAGAMLPGMAQAAAQPPPEQSMTVRVVDMAPTTPTYTTTPAPLTIVVELTNTSGAPLYDVSLDVERDVPVTRQAQLEQLMSQPAQSGDAGSLSPLPPAKVAAAIESHQTVRVSYHTTTSQVNDGKGICLCQSEGGGIYPVNFTALAASEPSGETGEVGFGQTYLPSFRDTPKPVQVSWVWPLIDRPHRLLDGSTFVDDGLAASIRPGGRLDRALTVVQQVATRVHLTLVIDPELIDELAVMSDHYQVDQGGKVFTGTGTEAARSWLTRLRSVILSTEVSLTPYADPDIDAVTRAGLSWSDNFGSQQLTRVQGALGFPAASDIAWPAGETITSAALRQLVSRGTSEVVLNDSTLSAARSLTPRPDALAPLPAQFGVPGSVAAVTDHIVQSFAGPILTRHQDSTATLPQLVSDLAVRASEQPDRSHYVVVTAGRYVDASPIVAARTILATARTAWSTSLTLGQAASTVQPVDHGSLVEPGTGAELAPTVLASAARASNFVRSFSSALTASDAATLLGTMPAAIQRTESSAWRVNRLRGASFSAALTRQIDKWQSGVYIVRPSNGTYTLASNDSPLFVTVVNTLPVQVDVRVSIATVNGVAGFSTDNVRVQRIPSGARSSLKIQAHVQRAGRFQVDASLLAPDGSTLGRPVRLNIHCTALGAVGVIITAVAGGVLVLALAWRVIRRMRDRPHGPTIDESPRPEPAGVGA
jgi:hypothetical protein